jgi:hypothetical protein
MRSAFNYFEKDFLKFELNTNKMAGIVYSSAVISNNVPERKNKK